jgi:tetratricopeptide (TPR) repeat protein
LIHSQKGLTERAAESFEKALAINPRYTEAALNLFVTYNDLQRFNDAERVFAQAAAQARHEQLDPFVTGKLANEHARLGDTYLQLGRHDEALTEYRKALALRPEFADVLAKVGVVLRETGRIDEAIAAFGQAKQANPAYVPAYIHLGVTYYAQGRFDQAAREWSAAQALDPSNRAVQAYVALGKRKAK